MNTEDMVQKLWEDMYVGRGKNDPPITVRMEKVETICENFSRNVNKILVGMVLILLGVGGDILKSVLETHGK